MGRKRRSLLSLVFLFCPINYCSMEKKWCSAISISLCCPFNCCSMERKRCFATAISLRRTGTFNLLQYGKNTVLPYCHLLNFFLYLYHSMGRKRCSATAISLLVAVWREHGALLLLSLEFVPIFVAVPMGRTWCSATAILWHCPFNLAQ